jgi:hypothetical protein
VEKVKQLEIKNRRLGIKNERRGRNNYESEINDVVLAKVVLLCARDWNLHIVCYFASAIINN